MRVFTGLLEGDNGAAGSAAATMAVVAAVCLLAAVWRLRSLQIS